VSESPAAIQITVDATAALRALDEAGQVLSVGFVCRIRRMGLMRCGICGKRRICYAIEVAGFGHEGAPAQIVGNPKCAQHAGIR
jgi:hypothetical protein